MGIKSIKLQREVRFCYKKPLSRLTQVKKICDLGLQEPLIKTNICMTQEEKKRSTLDFLPHRSHYKMNQVKKVSTSKA